MLLLFVSSVVHSNQRETIYATSSLGPSWGLAPAMRKILDVANRSQEKYNFILDFKPGADQLLAAKLILSNPSDRFFIIGPKYVEYINNGTLNRDDFEMVHSLGDGCWAVISNIGDERYGMSSLKDYKNVFVGSTAFGNVSHLAMVAAGEQFNFNVTFVPYKSNTEALLAVTSGVGLNATIDRLVAYENMKTKNPNLKLLGLNCDHRMKDYPNLKTLKEQGINIPSIFHLGLASKGMEPSKRKEIAAILEDATKTISREEYEKLCECLPPVLNKVSLNEYYDTRVNLMTRVLKKYEKEVKEGK